jgi:hypothetical protein
MGASVLRRPAFLSRDLREPDFAILLVACWVVVMLQLLAKDWATAARTMTDTDDAMRLVQVRAFLAGQGWFDLHEARLAPPVGYDSHWSRLIDAGLAGLFLFFRVFTDAARAEFLMRITWPLLWLMPAIAAVAALSWRLGGRLAALVTLLLLVVGMPAFHQFRPGRIDHHNVQIALALAVLATAAWADRARYAAAGCGALTGLALGVGLEGLPFEAIAGIFLAVRYAVDPARAPALRAYGLALAFATLGAFLVGVGPDHWARSACDAIAVNWMMPVAAAGLMSAAATALPLGRAARWSVLFGIGVIAAALFAAIEPRCLAGPYAIMDPSARTVWLSHVGEMQPLLQLLRDDPQAAAAIFAFPATALVALAWLGRDATLRRNPGYLVSGAAALVSFAMTVAAAKSYNYAVWMGMPLVALFALHLGVRIHAQTLAARFLVVILLTPAVVSWVAVALVQVAGTNESHPNPRVARGCFDSSNYAVLERLPRGVVAADVDYGPFILALTPHAVVGAPYHRQATGILDSHKVFALAPALARAVIDARSVDYLVTCGDEPPSGLSAAERDSGLAGRLVAGDLPDWLEKMPSEPGQAFTVYRIRRHQT